MKSNQKLKLLRLWEILHQETDAEHAISSVELVERLSDEDISIERKTLYSDLEVLVQSGYPIECIKGNPNRYFVRKRTFSEAELRLLMDCVQSANFIDAKKAKELAYKLADLAGSNMGEELARNTRYMGSGRASGEIWENINLISQSIRRKRRIHFRYFDYDVNKQRVYRTFKNGGDTYGITPLCLVYNDDNYYVIGYMDGRELYLTFRLDRMSDVRISSVRRETPGWVKNYPVDRYRKETFGMFSGERTRVSLLADDTPSVIGIVLDELGFDTQLIPRKDGTCGVSANVQLSPNFYAWLMSLGGRVRLIAPQDAKVSYRQMLADSLAVVDGKK
ncbi:MAG: WYL domain-containing protein [Clostridia bacterium]|nr:WYL domain-containing protein [Clostridia bacterium]